MEVSSGLSSESKKSGYWKGIAARFGSIGKTALNVAAMLCLGFKPFGEKPSSIVSVILFARATIFFFVRFAFYAGIVTSYTISIYWILKPILIQKFL